MTDGEIKTSVMQAKDQRAQIKICAELNDISEDEVKDILRNYGIDCRKLRGAQSRKYNRSTAKPEIETAAPAEEKPAWLKPLPEKPAEENKQAWKAVPAGVDIPAWKIVPKEPEITETADSFEQISKRINELVSIRDDAERQLQELRDKLNGLIGAIGGQTNG